MPNWKKVIVSGSNAALNSLTVATNVVAQSFTGSLQGTATSASFASTASYITGYANNGIEDYIPIWQNSGSLAKSIIFQKGNNTIGINRVNATATLDILSNGGGNTIANFETNTDPDVYIQLKNNVGYGYIGVNNKDFRFQPQGSTKAILSASGEFGLGTLVPKYTLDVVGSGNFSTNLTITGSLHLSSSLHSAQGTSAGVGTTTIVSVATGSFRAGFFDYVASSGGNARAGTVMSVWNGSDIKFTDNSTIDIGSTTFVTMSIALSGANALLRATINGDTWNIKTTYRLI